MGDDKGWESWRWDETLFSGAAPFYEQGRLPYAPGLEQALTEAVDLDGRGRLLDVGCGPGTIALRLCNLFEEVVALDPDPAMIAAATEAASRRRIDNVHMVEQRAEDLPAGLGAFQLITFAASFHWMDRPLVASRVRAMVVPDGAVAQIHAPAPGSADSSPDALEELPYPAPPDDKIDELRVGYLGRDRRAGRSVRNTSPSGEDAVFRAAGFEPCVEVDVPDGRVLVRTIDDLVALRLSTSGTAPHLFGDRLSAYVADLRSILENASPSGKFAVRLPDNVVRIWKPSDGAETSPPV